MSTIDGGSVMERHFWHDGVRPSYKAIAAPILVGMVLASSIDMVLAQGAVLSYPEPPAGYGYTPRLAYPYFPPPWSSGYGYGWWPPVDYGGMMGWRTPSGAGQFPAASDIDVDGDGMVSELEAMRQYDRVFQGMDTNQDGKVTGSEFQAAQGGPGRVSGGPRWAAPMTARNSNCFQVMDRDGDGEIRRDEFVQAAKGQFQAADLNGDGKVTVWEFLARNQR